MSIKLIVSDIDGTLIPFHGSVSERTRAAVRACAEKGVTFSIATGRWYVPAKAVTEAIGQTDGCMIIAGGGAIVTLSGEVIQEWGIPDARAEQVYAIMRKHDVMMNTFTRGNLYRLNTRAYGRRVDELDSYLGGAFLVHADDQALFERDGLKRPYKMEAYTRDEAKLREIAEELNEAGFSVTSSYPTNIEITERDMGKGVAVEWLANKVGATREECMAMGDNTNDLSLLGAVGWPIAMGNAVSELKSVARLIAPDSADDGAAIMIERALEDKL